VLGERIAHLARSFGKDRKTGDARELGDRLGQAAAGGGQGTDHDAARARFGDQPRGLDEGVACHQRGRRMTRDGPLEQRGDGL
jgi:hypothetical protein